MRLHQLSVLKWVFLVPLAGVGVAGHGCREPAEKASQAPSPALKTPRLLDVLAGTVPLEVVGDGVEVQVDGKPGPALKAGRGQLDTRTIEDGLRVLTLVRPGVGATLATVPVVV